MWSEMSDIAIRVENLGKTYRIGAQQARYKRFTETLVDVLTAPLRRIRNLGKPIPSAEIIWALRDVSSEVHRGEAVGIIGRNGAGKSTLLKVLSRITEPTVGEAEIHGRVGALLEVGTGFHPELTGRENIYLNGAILGMRKAEIERKFDEIVAFAEVSKFLDTPVKRYSSGMYVRLAFAVAAHLEPEVLLVDEVLAVGDVNFQTKCLGKMEDVAKQGRTVFFVSHNMPAIQNLCPRAIWLQDGCIQAQGASMQVVSKYLGTSFAVVTEQRWDDINSAPGNDSVRLRRVSLSPEGETPEGTLTIRTPLRLEFEYWNLVPGAILNLSVHLLDKLGITVFNTGPIQELVWNGRPFPVGLFRSVCHIPADLLNDGTYTVQLLVVKDMGIVIYKYDGIIVFDLNDSPEMRRGYYGPWPGIIRPNLLWTTELITSDL
jgi:lipopolysaccharide transport system ATP-binding protein